MSPPRPAGARSGERGAIRGCCLGLALMIVLTGAVAVLLLRLTDTPDLGSPPSGPDDGGSQQAIATTLAKAVASVVNVLQSVAAGITMVMRIPRLVA